MYRSHLEAGERASTRPCTGLKMGQRSGYERAIRAPRFTCWVDFAARLNGGSKAEIRSQTKDEPFTGTLEVITPTSFRLRLDRERGGCWNVDPRFSRQIVDHGTVFELD